MKQFKLTLYCNILPQIERITIECDLFIMRKDFFIFYIEDRIVAVFPVNNIMGIVEKNCQIGERETITI